LKVQTIIVDANDDINDSKVLEPRFRGKVAKKNYRRRKGIIITGSIHKSLVYVADKKYLWN